MASEWQKVRFGEIYDIPSRNGLTKPKNIRGHGVKFINMGEVFAHDRIFNVLCDRVPITSKEKETSLLANNDLLFARQSLVLSGAGKCSIFLGDQETVAFESHLIRVRINNKLACPLFLFYLFKSSIGRSLIWNITEQGAGQSGIRGSDLENITFKLPQLKEQKAIAHILGSLDDKIELNRQMNATLEAMAQALFKSWFVDFDPVLDNALAAGNPIPDELKSKEAARLALGDDRKPLPVEIQALFPSSFVLTEEMGWIPEGWEVAQLGNYVEVKRGGSPRPIQDYLQDTGLPWVKISDATASQSRFLANTKEHIKPEGLKKTVFLTKGSLILSNSATPGLPLFIDLDACIHDGWLYFPSKKVFSDLYLYQLFLLIREELILQGNGSVFTNLKTDILKNHILVVPSDTALRKFDSELDMISKRIHLIHLENQILANLRDTLLPKLLSGELRIPDAENLAAEVL